jgi:hypothetical protein
MSRSNTSHARAQRAALTEHWGTTKALQENARRKRRGANDKSDDELMREFLARGGHIEKLPPAPDEGSA